MDAYEIFFKEFNINPDSLVEFGIRHTIEIPEEVVKREWDILKERIEGYGNQPVYIRGAGRDAKTTELYFGLLKKLFPNGVFVKDPTNNAAPKKLLEQCTGFKRSSTNVVKRYERITNYQVTHIFGRTKNPFTFTAPWNVVYLPKVMDPFTGHESNGGMTERFTSEFQSYFYEKNRRFIEEYNNKMEGIEEEIIKYISGIDGITVEGFSANQLERFRNNVRVEFSKIIL